MRKRFILAIVSVVAIISAFIVIDSYLSFSPKVAEKKPFYFGVTYCGNSTTEAKQLIDRVKDYTNLFVLQSSPLMSRLNASQEICDYAVNAGLNIILYYSSSGLAGRYLPLIDNATARWGNHFLGVYFNDEPGGKMLDNGVMLEDRNAGISIYKGMNGYLKMDHHEESNGTTTRTNYEFMSSGEIIVGINIAADVWSKWNSTTYCNNGTISFQEQFITFNTIDSTEAPLMLWYQPDGTVQDENGTEITGKGDISQFQPYQQIWDSRPLQSIAETANLYVKAKHDIFSWIGNQSNFKLLTSDYALYWYDYMSGYDTVLAQLGWGNNPTQEIALVRGAAKAQDKSWGTIITWQSNNAPFLQSGEQMYESMRQSYESGAEYVVVFNYTPDTSPFGPVENATSFNDGDGLLKDEHFDAMKKFWTDIVENPSKTNNVTAQATFVLPNNYGWGMRNPNDTIWGIWEANETSQQIWSELQNKLAQYGSKIDIIYDDSSYPVTRKYENIYYWNQTSLTQTP